MIVIKDLAETIAQKIMTVSGIEGYTDDVTVERIALMKKRPDDTELNMGGRCTENVVEVIQTELRKCLCED